MAYEGEPLNACGVLDIDFSTTRVVAVSGAGPNVCGHLLLHAAGRGRQLLYFQVAGVHACPRYMTSDGYSRFLRENKKTELVRRDVDVPNPVGALLVLEQLMSKPWTWWVLPHNCVAFCEDVIVGGGGTWNSHSNCPAIATDAYLQDAATWLLNGIYSTYGIPR